MAGKGFTESTPEDRAELTQDEGRISFIYDDAIAPARKYVKGQAIKGNLTGGVGHLISRHDNIVDAQAYSSFLGKTIPPTVIDQWLDDDLDEAEKAVNDAVTVPLTSHQRGALIRFTFNVGVGAFLGSGLLKKINAKDFNAVSAEFAKWTKTTIKKNGVKVKITSDGLKNRRARETAYFFRPDKQAPTPLPKTVTKIEPKSSEVAEPEAKPTSPFEWASLALGGITGGSAFATAEGWVGVAIAVAIIAGVLIGAAIIIQRQFFPH